MTPHECTGTVVKESWITVVQKDLLHIQKFVEDEEGSSDFGGGKPGGSFKPVKSDDDGGGAKLYIQKGSKMNDNTFDDDAPF